ncbi:sensory rhodopsin [Haloarcula vallismortis]|uniref:Bacterial rhodopsin CSR3 n=3 Tax=Haloarcula vallismortis TaxID=28442 RepID=BAC3_HALVA|nr:bacteriorhodopsin CSR3 [Haloarcula vallismortis]Q48334.1 RecName: Full=Bacterial rhodopsin CSR3 [Haloarcula vallismortis]EMA00853.1 sensory rhodopsin I [Haloarcula vallismortis ATCC 29715]BAA12098.1 csR3 [Haloarcula vallismortis]SDW07737.1 sensory rhodopsin [Haloarcula vallismortis]
MDAVAVVYGITAAGFAVGVAIVGYLYASLEGSEERSILAALALIPGFAGISYVAMAFGIGTVTIGETTLVGFRYLDWVVTTPLLVGFVGYAAGASRRAIFGVMVADALMILTGVGAVVADGTLKWVLFGVSTVFHVSLFAYLYLVFPRSVPDDPQRIGLFSLLKNHIGLLWIAYPLVWLAGPEGLGLATYVGVSITYAFLDLLAKVPYVYFFYARRQVFATKLLRDSGEVTATPAD